MRKGVLPIILGVLLTISAFIAPIPIFVSMISQDKDETVFQIPTDQVVEISEPGRYYLWNNHQTVFEGEVFSHSEELPHGLKIVISDSQKKPLVFTADASTSSSSGASSKKSIGYVEVTHPQQLHISVSNTTEKRIFSFSQSHFKEFFTKLMSFFAIGVIGFFGGAALIVTGVIKLTKATKTPPPLPHAT